MAELRRSVRRVTVLKRAPQRRSGGYFIGLFGTGYSAAKRLGVMGDLHTRTPKNSKTWEVTRAGNRRKSVGFLDQPGEPHGVLRGDIEAALFQNLGDVEVRYGTEPTAIVDVEGGAVVAISTRSFVSPPGLSMRSWRSGRTVLMGDAAWCITLYSGMGASMGLAGGSLLGELMALNPNDIDAALLTWEDRLRPYIRQHQRTALFNAQIFTPSGPITHVLRSGVMRLGDR